MEWKKMCALTARNVKCYFKDKFLFFVSLLTPMILLVLFVTFLRTVYIDSFKGILALFDFQADESLLNGLAGSWLLSSVMSVCAVTVAVCSNAVMIQDKIDGSFNDFRVSPVKGTTLSLSYFVANFLVTLVVMLSVLCIGFVYVAIVGWQISFVNVLYILVDTLCCVLFGTLLANAAESFIRTQGALSALSSLVSGLYGFICGAYMPLSQFDENVRNILCVLPGTHGVCIMRKHFMQGYVDVLGEQGLSREGQKALMDGFDGNLYVGKTQMPLWSMYVILLGACAILLAVYVATVVLQNKKSRKIKRKG